MEVTGWQGPLPPSREPEESPAPPPKPTSLSQQRVSCEACNALAPEIWYTRELPGVALVNCAISHIFTIIFELNG